MLTARASRRLLHLALGFALSAGLMATPAARTLAAAAPLPPGAGNHGLSREVYGYLPYWRIGSATDAYLRYDLLSAIALFSAYFDGGGAVDTTTLLAASRAALIATIVQHAHAAGVRVELTLRPATDTAAANDAFLLNAAARAAAIAGTVAAVAVLGLDGVSLDAESIYNADFPAYGAFAGALRAALVAANPAARLTVATNGNVSGASIARQVTDAGADRVFLMGYSYRSAGANPAGSISPLVRFDGGSLSLTASLATYAGYGVPAGRIILGLPYYGLTWPTVSNVLHAATTGGGVNFFPVDDMASVPAGTAVQHDPVEQAAWFAVQDPLTQAWQETYFDDETSLLAKYAFASGRGLAGVGIWALGYDRGVSGYWEAIAGSFGVVRLAGADRYATAAAVSADLEPTGAATALLATGANFADALAGAAAAGRLHAPVLLTQQLSLPSATAAELNRLKPSRVVLLGAEAAIGPAVEAAVRALLPGATVDRYGGSDRYATAALVSHAVFGGGAPVAFVASGVDGHFADALAGAAQGARLGGPILLATLTTLPGATHDELVSLHPSHVYVLGGPAAIGQPVLDAITLALPGVPLDRLGGADRYATAVAISGLVDPAPPVVYVATGLDFPDGLAGAAAAGQLGGPLLLTDRTALPAVVATELARLKPRRIVIVGGSVVVSDAVATALREALATP